MSANDSEGDGFGTWFDEYCEVAERAFLEADADRVLSYAHLPLLFVGHDRTVTIETPDQLERQRQISGRAPEARLGLPS